MLKLGFNHRWVDLIMMCVTTVKYSVLVNGKSVRPIQPSRGLRQGCPLSLYLFMLCDQGLFALIENAEQRGLLHGVKICWIAPSIFYFLFEDDSFFSFGLPLANVKL